jgi:hypothetical protein
MISRPSLLGLAARFEVDFPFGHFLLYPWRLWQSLCGDHADSRKFYRSTLPAFFGCPITRDFPVPRSFAAPCCILQPETHLFFSTFVANKTIYSIRPKGDPGVTLG